MVLRARVCKLCGDAFQVERKPGKPRSYCFDCQPAGWKLTRVRGRWKLRRWPPAFSWAELRRPPEPGEFAHLSQFRRPSGRGGEAA